MTVYAKIEPTISTMESCSGQVRWDGPILQQLWVVTTYRNNSPTGQHEEWRDVPDKPAGEAEPEHR